MRILDVKRLTIILMGIAAGRVWAGQDGAAIAARYNCLGCHQVDQKIVGPAYRDVAAKYRADKGAEARLIEKVKKGGVGVWGKIPMPAQVVKEEDLKLIMQWVLSQK